jgi:hypothetical protein
MHLPKKPVTGLYWDPLKPQQNHTNGESISQGSVAALEGLHLMAKRLNYRGGFE